INSWTVLPNAGMGGPGGCWTLNIGGLPNDASVCSLSDALEDAGNVAAAVLFDAPRLRWNPPPRREARQRIAPTVEGRAGRSGANNFATSGGIVSGTIAASGAGTERTAGQHNET